MRDELRDCVHVHHVLVRQGNGEKTDSTGVLTHVHNLCAGFGVHVSHGVLLFVYQASRGGGESNHDRDDRHWVSMRHKQSNSQYIEGETTCLRLLTSDSAKRPVTGR